MLDGARNPPQLSGGSNLVLNFATNLRDTTKEPISKIADRVQWQGVPWVESGAYTIVREHFKPRDNTASGR